MLKKMDTNNNSNLMMRVQWDGTLRGEVPISFYFDNGEKIDHSNVILCQQNIMHS